MIAYDNQQLCLILPNTIGSRFSLIQWIENQYEQPIYLYDLSHIQRRYQLLEQALPISSRIFFAMKANSNREILKTLCQLGAGVDVVSGGELQQALAAGYNGNQVIFSGVGKTIGEIRLALSHSIFQINVESLQELIRIGELASQMKCLAPVGLRLNPGVDAGTHPYITTGLSHNKFGIDESQIGDAQIILEKYRSSLILKGLSVHIGSQIRDLAILEQAISKIKNIYLNLLNEGYQLKTFDIGGGLGMDYEAQVDEDVTDEKFIAEYGQMVGRVLSDIECQILTEPGRILVARSGLLLSQVQYIKKNRAREFIILDTGMHHLLRPALYGGFHRVLPLRIYEDRAIHTYDIVGPICESADFIAKDRRLYEIRSGEFVAITDVGAYGYAMASHYNGHALPIEYVLRGACAERA